ncbi:hypothetical protein EWM64_g9055 [Hericium alpestre]|uniref:BTB domain-containing protein n=1 Tax=Hericium alpestre TaxID=135208 RepID=A0A4Y9ZN66_9AGAM|nr:hypothetical protein EWM64_g9055 [Hericium alpestre]
MVAYIRMTYSPMESNQWDYILQSVTEGLNTPAPVGANLLERPKLVHRSQISTPPDSAVGSPEQDRNLVSVSTTFFPGADLDLVPADICLLSSDSVFFYVHSHRLLASSSNNFDAILPSPIPSIQRGEEPKICIVPDDSAVMNILLHTIYNMSAAHYSPPTQSIIGAVESMVKYGIPIKAFIAPSTPLFLLLSAKAVINPIEIYTLAASLDIPELAEVTSTHLLSYSLPSLTDDMAIKMGPVYLKRLFFLHLGRTEAFKRLLLPPPANHTATAACDVEEQQKLTRAWMLATAYLAWEAKPDLNTTVIESALCPLADHLTCEQCKRSLKNRVMELVMQWALIKKTI